jgi:hypothetical protein
MKNARLWLLGPLHPCRAAPAVAAAALGLSSMIGCTTTHTIAPDQLPAALAGAPEQDRRRLVKGEDGKPVELPSPAHLRWVQVQTDPSGEAQTFHPPVTAKQQGSALSVEGKDGQRTYPLSAITSVRVRHDDHKADTIGGAILLSLGTSFLVAGAAVAIWDAGRPDPCGPGELLCFDRRGLFAGLIGIPAGVVGLGLAIPGAILTVRGATGLGKPPKERAAQQALPVVSVGLGRAALAVPF